MRRIWVAGLGTVAAGILFSGATAWAAPPVTLECGQTVTTSVKLGNDLLNCPEDGIVVGASNITIDLNGHRVTGPPQESGDPAFCFCGVNDQAGFDNVTLRSGSIEGFRNGASFEDAEAVTVRHLVTSGQRTNPYGDWGNGVFLQRTHGAHVTASTFTDAWRGVLAQDSSEVVIGSVHVSESEHAGVALKRDTDSILRRSNIEPVLANNEASNYGVEIVNSSRTLVERNRIKRGQSDGIALAGVTGFEGNLPAVGNRIERNVVSDAGDVGC